MTKQAILQEIFMGDSETIWHIRQADVCSDTWIKSSTLGDYIHWRHKPSDETMNTIIDSACKIAKLKYDFSLSVKRSWWDK